ncbi:MULTISPECIES: sensor histidine kinase [Mesorhizobium]|uniref:sensor histidine kinase n=1 Tax=Mesorhizobium TaxID=68287 RepID=UPI00197DCB47|nr:MULTISPECIES: histidine kinase dimerization/phosphoacceptor domain -containing protein [Mesorhizobium]
MTALLTVSRRPISIISLVDHDRIWFKSHHGLEAEQIDRGPGLCASAILHDGPWLVENAPADPRTLANPLVAGECGLKFYLGIPLRTSDGHNLGTLCVIDREPRTASDREIAQLKDLASIVMDQMELRLSARTALREASENLASLAGAVSEKEAALKQSELMAKEIDHRVMNSLQLVSSLLTLQSRIADDDEASRQLASASTRITAVARVHQHLYLGEEVEAVDVKSYLQRLSDDLSRAVGLQEGGTIIVESENVELTSKQIVPLGLIVNELVTNAAKHGAGQIKVSFRKLSLDAYELAVSDDGGGLPAGFDPSQSGGLGMKVVASLARQLGGELAYTSGGNGVGTRFAVDF